MSDFSKDLNNILKNYQKNTGLSIEDSWGIFNWYRQFALELAGSTNQNKLQTFSTIFSVIVKVFPVICTVFTAILLPDATIYKLWFSITIQVGLDGFLVFLESLLPKDISSWKDKIALHEMYRALATLAGQITFYAKLDAIDHNNNKDRIEKLSKILENPISTAIYEKWDILKPYIENGVRNTQVENSQVSLKQVSSHIYEEFGSIAEVIHDACSIFFGPARYSVKIYLRTEHLVNDKKVEVLTSLIKFPRKNKHANAQGGRSWLNCDGVSSTAWELIRNGKKDFITFVNEAKGDVPGETYPSIIYIRLPEGVGVLTIVSSKESTFNEEAEIRDDIISTLMVATNAAARQALNKIDH